MQQVYLGYTELLQRSQGQMKLNEESRVKYYDLRDKTSELLKRQISLREMIDETQGYNEGYMAAAFEFFHGRTKKYTSPMLMSHKRKGGFMRGFRNGASRESRRLDKIAKEYKKKSRRNVKIKSRPVQQKLWDCGIFEIEPKDPFRNMTVGLSDEEEDDSDVDELVDMVGEMTV
jgi:hypothetical protein